MRTSMNVLGLLAVALTLAVLMNASAKESKDEAAIRAVLARSRADTGPAEFHPDRGTGRVRIIHLDVPDPVLMHVAAEQDGIGERALAHRRDESRARRRPP